MTIATARMYDSFARSGTHGETVKLGRDQFDVFFVSRDGPALEFFFRDEQGGRFGNFERARAHLHARGKRLRFATNAGIFLQLPNSAELEPEGLFVQDGKEIVPLNTRQGTGNFYLQPNGVFAVTRDGFSITATRDYSKVADVVHATQSGPLLVLEGTINSRFSQRSTRLNIRSGVGVIDRDTAVFVISREPVSFRQFATVFLKVLRCKNALYLDGAISQMYLPEVGRKDMSGDFSGLIIVSEDEDGP